MLTNLCTDEHVETLINFQYFLKLNGSQERVCTNHFRPIFRIYRLGGLNPYRDTWSRIWDTIPVLTSPCVLHWNASNLGSPVPSPCRSVLSYPFLRLLPVPPTTVRTESPWMTPKLLHLVDVISSKNPVLYATVTLKPPSET